MFREVNWFADPRSSDRHRRYQRYSTRLCIVLIIMSLVTIGVLTGRSELVSVQTVLRPSQAAYESLYEQHSQQVTCPCSSISISQSSFLSIEPHFHQLCSSDLMSWPWIVNSNPNLPAWDFRRIAPAYFRLLQIFCEQSSILIAISLRHFYDTKFINRLLVSPNLFEAQADASVAAWRSSLTRQFAYQIELLSSMIGGNQLLSSLNFNYDARRTSADVNLQPSAFANCSCRLSSKCSRNVTIYSDDPASNDSRELYQFPNFFYGCFPTAGLLQSTLECFYDPFCLAEIERHLSSSPGTSFNFTALDANLNNPHESVSSILSRSLVDAWQTNILFDAYYAACAPQSCSFPSVVRASVFSVVTTILGLLGGVTFVFEMVFLILLRLVEKFALALRWTRQNRRDAMRRWFTCADQERTIQQLHFIFVLVALSALYLLNTFAPKLVTVQVSYPSLYVYQSLAHLYPGTLDCSCSNIAIKYSSFLQMETSAHQVCSSVFLTDAWIAAALNLNDSLDSAPEQFRLLNSLCFWSQQSLEVSLNQLDNAALISTTPMSLSLLSARMQATIETIISMASTSFLNLLLLFRQIIGKNQIMTALSTNWQLFSLDWNSTEPIVSTRALSYQSCSCAQSSSCVQASGRMYAGCYPLEALLQANLQCLYNQSCIGPRNTFPALTESRPSRFSETSTVEGLIEQLMIEQLISRISYESYFAGCAPTVCSYSYSTQGDRLEAWTILISLYGGLMVIGRWLAVILVRIGRCRTPPTASSLT